MTDEPASATFRDEGFASRAENADGSLPYAAEIAHNVPRLLALYDRDPLSQTKGCGDRMFWAWKLSDYANATPQGVANGLARLAAAGRLPFHLDRAGIINRIDEMVLAVARITAADGSLVEAFPNEKSFCVTALIAYDILCASEHLDGLVEPSHLTRWRETAAPLISFITKNDETHAIISNHLATAVAALMRWQGAGARAAHSRAHALLDRILEHQSGDGWFSEYGGPDPGYETLGLYYLADVHLRHPELGLGSHLSRALDFLAHAAHPDGSFGGLYGSRNTRFIVPGGLEALAPSMPVASALARFARRSIAAQRCVTLSAIDEPNFSPLFNAYALADCTASTILPARTEPLPCERKTVWRKHFSCARLVVDNGPGHYTVIAAAKGGVVIHARKNGTPARIEAGAAGRKGRHAFTTQAYRTDNAYTIEDDRMVITAPFIKTIAERPSPAKFIILRALALTLFRYRPVTEFVKRVLVRRLITRQRLAGVLNRRTIHFGADLSISDTAEPAGKLEIVRPSREFAAIHMASSGYWQRGDDP